MAGNNKDSGGTWVLFAILAVAFAPIASFWLIVQRDAEKRLWGIVLLVVWLVVAFALTMGAAMQ